MKAVVLDNVSGLVSGVWTLESSEVSELRLGELGDKDGVRV